MKEVRVGDRVIGGENPVFIIAEIGVNHNGDPTLAKKMIDAIAQSGADCVKFQTFRANEFCNSPDDTYEYKSQGKVVTESMLAMFQRVELKYSEFEGLFKYARKQGLIPLATPTDKDAVDLLDGLDAPAFKVGSDDLVYTPFLEYVASKGKPIIISTGMAEVADVERAVRIIRNTGNENIIVLHCVSLYPTPTQKLNLRKIVTWENIFDLPVGFSDHSDGIAGCLGATALGAVVLEKHFTLDKNFPGPDHWFSMDTQELNALVREVRNLEMSLGNGELALDVAQREMAQLCHRSIVLARDLPERHVVTEDDLSFKRPGLGLMPYELNKVIGLRTVRPLKAGSNVELYDLEKVRNVK